MWSSSGGHKDHSKGVSVSPSKQKPSSSHHNYPSTCSCSSPPPISHIPPTTPTKSMDEIWNDINLISSLHSPTAAAAPTTNSAAFHLQDFLPPSPFTKEYTPPVPHVQSQQHSTPSAAGCGGGPRYSAPPPATALKLGSGPHSGNRDPKKSRWKQQSRDAVVEKPPQVFSLTPPCGTWHSFRNKRPAENENEEENSADVRFKRMIKNRESAARSRDRKHAYTYDLELEVARLKKENAKMRRQQEMMCLPAPPAQLPKKPTLSRTLTAPF